MRYARLTPPAVLGGQAPTPWILGNDSIARGPGSRFIVTGWPGVDQVIQSIPYLGGNYQRNLPQYNRSITYSLICEYEFASESACFLFVCQLPLLCPLAGLLEMGIVNGAKVSYPNALIERIVPVIGTDEGQVVSTRLRYDIVAGAPGGIT